MKITDIISHLWAAKGVLTLPVHLDLFSLAFASTIIKEVLHNEQIWKTELFRFLAKIYD